MTTYHSKKAAEFLKEPAKINHFNDTFWQLRTKRDTMAKSLPEWEELREKASAIKQHTLTHLADYIEQFTANLEKNGVIVHFAADAKEFNEIALGILQKHKVQKLVKSKSMLTEECNMNDYLIKHGIKVIESDLGERILQLLKLKPCHIVVPAAHVTRQEIGKMFEERGISKDIGNYDPTYLTRCCRLAMRHEFIEAEAGMTGCNFGVAETGDVVVCTNEGNADMSTSIPKLHIVSMGIEKIIPNYDSLSVFQRLLARSGTGQPSTAYTSHFRKARPGGEMHVILVDNGRSKFVGNEQHWETLKCIRCGTCMNTCPVYRRSTGYSYNYFIPGPIGVDLGMLHNPQKHSGNVSACSLCLSCDCVCPVHVNPGSQIYVWRQQLENFHTENKEKRMLSEGMKAVYSSFTIYNALLKEASLANYIPETLMENKFNAWSIGHKMPKFAKKPFHTIFKEAMEELRKEERHKEHSAKNKQIP